jgi:hypothetical protein
MPAGVFLLTLGCSHPLAGRPTGLAARSFNDFRHWTLI